MGGVFSMTGNLYQDWPVYVLLGGAVVWIIWLIIKSNLADKKDDSSTKKDNK
jgi:hypothetical protein